MLDGNSFVWLVWFKIDAFLTLMAAFCVGIGELLPSRPRRDWVHWLGLGVMGVAAMANGVYLAREFFFPR